MTVVEDAIVEEVIVRDDVVEVVEEDVVEVVERVLDEHLSNY